MTRLPKKSEENRESLGRGKLGEKEESRRHSSQKLGEQSALQA